MSAFVADPVSEHIGITSEGFAICTAAIVGRTGMMEYRCSELGIAGGDQIVRVWRDPSELFSKISMSSGNGKPIVSPHPGHFVTSGNWSSYSKGHAQNLRPGTERLPDGNWGLLADLVISDALLVEQVRNGLVDLSGGYDCEYRQRPDGDLEQINILYNHFAIVAKARGGNTRIMDAEEEQDMSMRSIENLEKKFDEFVETVTTLLLAKGVVPKPAKTEQRKPTTDGRPLSLTEVRDLIEDRDREASFAYGEACNAVGAKMRERGDAASFETILKRYRGQGSQVNDAEENWADALNRRGRELRERR